MLGAHHGLTVGERREGLVTLYGQEQALQVAAQAVPLIALGEEWIELLAVVFERAGGGSNR
jgi:hypothetical protein